jgi:hypothetical protein
MSRCRACGTSLGLIVQVEEPVLVAEGKPLAGVKQDIAIFAAKPYRLYRVLLDHRSGTQQVVHLRGVQRFAKTKGARTTVRVYCPEETGARLTDVKMLAGGCL